MEGKEGKRGILDSVWLKVAVAAAVVAVPLAAHYLLGIGLVQDALIAAGSRVAGKELDAAVWRERFESIGHPYLGGLSPLSSPHIVLGLALYGTYLLRRGRPGREREAERLALGLAFAAWLVVTAMAVATHEPWEDELHAWQIAQFGAGRMFREMGYEGHFLLWFAILHPLAAHGAPVWTLGLVSWAINAAGMWLLVRKGPFPVYVKLLVMFSVPFLYFNPAIARPYVMIPPLLWLLAGTFREAGRKPVRYCVLLVLLAHTHLYMEGLVGACGVMFVVRDIVLPWRSLSAGERRRRLAGLGVAVAGGVLAVMQVLPAFSQSSFSPRLSLQPGNAIYFLTVSGIRSRPAMIVAVLAMLALLLYAFFADKESFIVAVASLLFMYLFSILIYPAFVENRAVLWFYILIFTVWLLQRKPDALSPGCAKWRAAALWIPLSLLSLLLFQPERNAHDLNHDFYPSIRPVCDYINRHEDSSVPVFSTQDTALVYLDGSHPVYEFDSFPPEELQYRSYEKGVVSLHDEEHVRHFAAYADAVLSSGQYGSRAYFIFFLLPGEQVEAVRDCVERAGERYSYTVCYPQTGIVTDGMVLVEVSDTKREQVSDTKREQESSTKRGQESSTKPGSTWPSL